MVNFPPRGNRVASGPHEPGLALRHLVDGKADSWPQVAAFQADAKSRACSRPIIGTAHAPYDVTVTLTDIPCNASVIPTKLPVTGIA